MSATSPPDGTMRADARRNRQRLIEAALAAFADHGADDASLDEIARRAGVGIGTLYRHFPTRQALLEAVYRSQVEALCVRAQDFSDRAGGASATDAIPGAMRDRVWPTANRRSVSAAAATDAMSPGSASLARSTNAERAITT